MRPGDLLSSIRRHLRPQQIVMALCGILLLAYGASTWVSLKHSHHQMLDDAVTTVESMTRSVEIGTNRAIFEADMTLLGVSQMLAEVLPDTPLNDASVKVLLRQLNDQNLVVRDLLILGPDGQEM